MRNITAVIVDRANYGRLQPLLDVLQKDKDFKLSIICCGSTVLKRFHIPALSVKQRYGVTHMLYHEVEGSNKFSTINSMAILMPQLSVAFEQNNPDYVLIIGDRFETLAVATVASMQKICICHVQGGEQSGNIDNSIRHAITKLSHYHLPATKEAKITLENMGEHPSTILGTGCPVADLVDGVVVRKGLLEKVLCVYHPEDDVNNTLITSMLLGSLSQLGKKVLMLWPNIDPNSEGIVKTIRRYINEEKPDWLKMVVNFTPREYLEVLASVKCCVGNSSSFVRDASFFGTPVVLIGGRQYGRLRTNNIKWFDECHSVNLHSTIKQHMMESFVPSNVYGNSGICEFVVKVLKSKKPYSQKVNYV